MARRRKFLRILSGCLVVVILLIGSCASLAYVAFRNANVSASPMIDAVFAAIADNTFADTYHEDLTRYAGRPISKEEVAAIGENIAEQLGKLRSKSLENSRMRWDSGVSLLNVAYNGKFEKGEGTILATLRKDDRSNWQLVGFRVQSPVLEQGIAVIKCPECGRRHTASAKFCPSCGARVDAATSDAVAPEDPLHKG
jgi:rubrerythrin